LRSVLEIKKPRLVHEAGFFVITLFLFSAKCCKSISENLYRLCFSATLFYICQVSLVWLILDWEWRAILVEASWVTTSWAIPFSGDLYGAIFSK
jgi:glucan phosphoethanolaminetransferase (alkaline phosphatase superfamily)